MYMRLGFAVAIHVDPDVLLVDEVLAVGDEGFTHKCLDKFAEFRRRGKTILLVTHSLGLVERFCDEALWLDGGAHQGASGDPKRVVGAYVTDVEDSEEQQLAAGDAKAQESAGDGLARRAGVARCCPTIRSRPPSGRPTCSARPKAAGARARSRSPTSRCSARDGEPAHVFHTRRADRRPRCSCARRVADRRLRLRHRHLQRRRRLLLRHQHRPRGAERRAHRRRRRGDVRDRQPRPGRRHLQARRRGPQARRLPVRLPPAALHVPREVADQGRRHLPAAAPLDVLRRRRRSTRPARER